MASGLPDILLLAVGEPRTSLPPAEAQFVAWLGRHQHRVRQLISICTGAFVLGEAGLLDGLRIITHFHWLSELKKRFPHATVVSDAIFVQAGRVWTSAGITSGIDLTLALVENQQGHATAAAVAKNLLLFLRRSGGQAQFSEALRQQALEPNELRGITAFVHEHMHEILSLERMARGLGMSRRSLSRACRERIGESPAALVRRLRLKHAWRLLERLSPWGGARPPAPLRR